MAANASRAALFLLATALALPAAAQNVGELANVQAETMLVKAKAARAEAYAKLNEATKTGGEPSTGTDTGMPVVRGVYGSGERLYATFLYSNGSTVDARRGDSLPGGFVVSGVSASRVELRRAGRTHVIGFSDVRPMATAASRQAANSGPALAPSAQPIPQD